MPTPGVPGQGMSLLGGLGHFWMHYSILSPILEVCQEEDARLSVHAPDRSCALWSVVCLLPSHTAPPASRDGSGRVDMADKEIISCCCCFICCSYHKRLPVQEALAACFLWLCELLSTTGHRSPKFHPRSLSTNKEM